MVDETSTVTDSNELERKARERESFAELKDLSHTVTNLSDTLKNINRKVDKAEKLGEKTLESNKANIKNTSLMAKFFSDSKVVKGLTKAGLIDVEEMKEMSGDFKEAGNLFKQAAKTIKNNLGTIVGTLTAGAMVKGTLSQTLDYGYADRKFGASEGDQGFLGRMYGTLNKGFLGTLETTTADITRSALKYGQSSEELQAISLDLARDTYTTSGDIRKTMENISLMASQAVTGMEPRKLQSIYTEAMNAQSESAESVTSQLWQNWEIYKQIQSNAENVYGLEKDRIVMQKEFNEELYNTWDLLKDQNLSLNNVGRTYGTIVDYFQRMDMDGAKAAKRARELTEAMANIGESASTLVKFTAGEAIRDQLLAEFGGIIRSGNVTGIQAALLAKAGDEIDETTKDQIKALANSVAAYGVDTPMALEQLVRTLGGAQTGARQALGMGAGSQALKEALRFSTEGIAEELQAQTLQGQMGINADQAADIINQYRDSGKPLEDFVDSYSEGLKVDEENSKTLKDLAETEARTEGLINNIVNWDDSIKALAGIAVGQVAIGAGVATIVAMMKLMLLRQKLRIGGAAVEGFRNTKGGRAAKFGGALRGGWSKTKELFGGAFRRGAGFLGSMLPFGLGDRFTSSAGSAAARTTTVATTAKAGRASRLMSGITRMLGGLKSPLKGLMNVGSKLLGGLKTLGSIGLKILGPLANLALAWEAGYFVGEQINSLIDWLDNKFDLKIGETISEGIGVGVDTIAQLWSDEAAQRLNLRDQLAEQERLQEEERKKAEEQMGAGGAGGKFKTKRVNANGETITIELGKEVSDAIAQQQAKMKGSRFTPLLGFAPMM